MMLTLSPFAVDSLTPSFRHIVSILHALRFLASSQLQAKDSYMSRPIPVPASISFMQPLHGVPSSSTPLHMPTSSPSSDRPPSSRVRRTTSSVICCYDRLI